jgi:hypothetical protein
MRKMLCVLLLSGKLNLNSARACPIKEQSALSLCSLVWLGFPGSQAQSAYFLKRCGYVIHGKTKVVQAGSIGLQPVSERVLFGKRLYELQLGIAQVQMGQANRSILDGLAEEHGEAEAVAPYFQRLFDIRYYYGQVIQTFKHGYSPRIIRIFATACARASL